MSEDTPKKTLKSNAKVIDVKFIGPKHAKNLNNHGIKDAKQLANIAADAGTPERFKEVMADRFGPGGRMKDVFNELEDCFGKMNLSESSTPNSSPIKQEVKKEEYDDY